MDIASGEVVLFHANIYTLRWTPDVCADTYLSPLDYAHTIVPRHVCARTRLCPNAFLPTHVCAHTVCAQTRWCSDTLVPLHVCAQTRFCPHMFVPTYVCALTCYNCVVTIMSGQKRVRLCPDTFVPKHIFCALKIYNKITKYARRKLLVIAEQLLNNHTSLRQQQLSMLVFSPIKLTHD